MKIKIRIVISVLFITFVSIPVFTQILEHPLKDNSFLGANKIQKVTVRSDEPLSLPFADDFSQGSGYPDNRFWIDNQAFINNTFGLNPPSIGIATLDGLNAAGKPYGGGFGGSDTLTSRPIDLSDEQSAYLSFYLQAKGIGYIPRTQDSLIVEGKSMSGDWINLESFEGLESSFVNKDAPEFQRVSISLSSEFRHDHFQFRFRNYSTNKGLEGLWHLDYVMVTRQEQDRFIDDIAFTNPPAYLIQRYSAYPLPQIVLDPERLNDQLPIYIRNHSRDRFTIDTSRVEIYDQENNQSVFTDESLLEIPPIVSENQRNINPGSVHFTNSFNLKDVSAYLKQTDLEKLTLTTEYEYVMRAERQLPSFTANNRVIRRTHFDNYLAYDDNSVEGSVSAYNGNGITTQIAVEYDLVEADSLHSIRIVFPYLVENYEDKIFNLLIYIGELKEKADYKLAGLQPKRGNHFQPFTEYSVKDYLPEGIELPAGKFYIGWEHPRGTDKDYIPFGFDKNYPDANQYIFYNVGSGWLNVATNSPDLKGAIAMRPVVGRKDVLTNSDEAIMELSNSFYPNPTSSVLNIRDGLTNKELSYNIYHVNGQLYQSGTIVPGQNSLDVHRLVSGSYSIILIEKSGTIFGSHRFIKQ